MTTSRRVVPAIIVAVGILICCDIGRAVESPPVHRHVFANGMTVLVRESRVARVVSASLQVRTGVTDEDAAVAGITNLTQRVMVRGTARRTAAEVIALAEDLGGGIEASGDVDHAEIRGNALSRHWQPLLDVIAEIALTPAFAADELERTRRLVLGQIRTRADAPLSFAMDAMMRELYGPHPYALPSGGRDETVAAITREAVLAHYRKLYRPERLVLAVSGDVPADRVLHHVERLFAKIPRGQPEDRATMIAPEASGSRRVFERPAQQSQILVGYLGPRLLDADYPAVKVLVAVLGGGTAGRLFRELRERRGLAYSVSVQNPSRREPSALVSYLGTEAGNSDAAEVALRQEIDRLRQEGPGAEELVRAKAYVRGTLSMDRRTNARQAWYLAFFELAGAGWDFPDRYARAIETVTAADVTAAAARYLVRPTTIVLKPLR